MQIIRIPGMYKIFIFIIFQSFSVLKYGNKQIYDCVSFGKDRIIYFHRNMVAIFEQR